MNVAQYTFQSPSPNQFQVGKPDPSSQKSDATTNSSTSESKTFQTTKITQTKEVEPTVSSEHTLDIYA